MKHITSGIYDSQCCILIFLCNARINQCCGTHSKLSYIQITIYYGNELAAYGY